jgi:hypothetical protein
MKTFLSKLEEKITLMEKHFDDDARLNASLNNFLYQYEVNSQITYGTLNVANNTQKSVFSDDSVGDSMLFCS